VANSPQSKHCLIAPDKDGTPKEEGGVLGRPTLFSDDDRFLDSDFDVYAYRSYSTDATCIEGFRGQDDSGVLRLLLL
jgi:hypothetical protein